MKMVSINISEYYHLKWPEWMSHLKSFGFNDMEIAINEIREREKIDEVLRLLQENNIKASAVHDWFHFFSPNDSEGIRAAQERLILDLEYTRILNSDKLIWYTGPNDHFQGDAALQELLKRLEPVLKRAEELNITLLLETEFVKDSCDPAASVKLLKKLFKLADTPFLACNYDAANLYVAGEEPFPYGYEELKPWIKYIHMKDSRELVEGAHLEENMKGYLLEGKKSAVSCALGEGAVNMHGLIEALRADNYKGYLSLELHIPRHPEAPLTNTFIQYPTFSIDYFQYVLINSRDFIRVSS